MKPEWDSTWIGNDKIALTAGAGIENGLELKLAQRAKNGGDVTVRARTFDTERIGQGKAGRGNGAGESAAKGFNLCGTQMRDVGDGAGFDLAGLAVGLAKENSRW